MTYTTDTEGTTTGPVKTQAEADARWPLHAQVRDLDGKNDVIGEFLDYLRGENYAIVEISQEPGEEYNPVYKSHQDWIAEFFEIDKKAFDAETEDIYKQLVEDSRRVRPGSVYEEEN